MLKKPPACKNLIEIKMKTHLTDTMLFGATHSYGRPALLYYRVHLLRKK